MPQAMGKNSGKEIPHTLEHEYATVYRTNLRSLATLLALTNAPVGSSSFD